MERIPYPHRNGYDCIEIKSDCDCSCHNINTSIMHIVACCDYNMQVTKYTDIRKVEYGSLINETHAKPL